MENWKWIAWAGLAFAVVACGKTRDLGSNVPGESGGSAGVGGTDAGSTAGDSDSSGGSGGSSASCRPTECPTSTSGPIAGGGGSLSADVELLGAVGYVDDLAADATHVYLNLGMASVVSMSLATGELTPIVSSGFAVGIAVDDQHLYFCDEAMRLGRVGKKGGGIEVAEPPDNQVDNCGRVLLTDDAVYTAAYDGDQATMLRYTKSAFDVPEALDVPGPWSREFVQGDSLYWVSLENDTWQFIRFSLLDDSVATLLSQPRQGDAEQVSLWGVDEGYMDYLSCKADGSCTFYRLAIEGGDPESFAAFTNASGVSYAAVAGGYVYAGLDERLVRFAVDGELEEVWVFDDVIDRLFPYGDHLYIAAVPNLYSLALD